MNSEEWEEVTSQLGTSYQKMKAAEKEKNHWKNEFFRMIDNEVGEDKPFEFVNESDGFLYSRQISQGAPSLDDEKLRKEDPELWEEITHVPEPERVLKPLEELDPDQIAKLGNYLVPGKKMNKLAAPKKIVKE